MYYKIILNFDPKMHNMNLPDLQTEHIYDKACHEDAQYQISFLLA